MDSIIINRFIGSVFIYICFGNYFLDIYPNLYLYIEEKICLA